MHGAVWLISMIYWKKVDKFRTSVFLSTNNLMFAATKKFAATRPNIIYENALMDGQCAKVDMSVQ